MGRYYFDVSESGHRSHDNEGTLFAAPEQAWMEAVRSVAELARESIPKHAASHEVAIEVRDDNGPVLGVKVTFEAQRHRK